MFKDVIENYVLYARVFRAGHISTNSEFFTREDDEIQFGIVNYEKNHKTGAHYHNHPKTKTNQTDEIMIVQKGSFRADFYNLKGAYIKSLEIRQGDILILYRGGHNLVFKEDTKVFTIHPGAYEKENDNTRIVGANNSELIIEQD